MNTHRVHGDHFNMTHPSATVIVLILLLIGYTAAGSTSDLKPRAIRSTACQEHTSLHTRLDKVEKTAEDTVDKLEAELAALLDAMEAQEWRPLLVTGSKTSVNILESLDSESDPERGTNTDEKPTS